MKGKADAGLLSMKTHFCIRLSAPKRRKHSFFSFLFSADSEYTYLARFNVSSKKKEARFNVLNLFGL